MEFPKYKEATPAQKTQIKSLVGPFIVDQINQFLDGSTSPVKGQGKLKNLKKDGSPSRLFETGGMRSFIDFEDKSTNVIDIGVLDGAPEVEQLKAINHNIGDTLPRRAFIPEKGNGFKKQINAGIRRIINEVLDGN